MLSLVRLDNIVTLLGQTSNVRVVVITYVIVVLKKLHVGTQGVGDVIMLGAVVVFPVLLVQLVLVLNQHT